MCPTAENLVSDDTLRLVLCVAPQQGPSSSLVTNGFFWVTQNEVIMSLIFVSCYEKPFQTVLNNLLLFMVCLRRLVWRLS
jgi:hypothetical protein